MFDIRHRLGVQSWCFREFKPLPALFEKIKSIGLSRVELCGVHADFKTESAFAPVIAAAQSAGITITSIGVQYFGNDPIGTEENYFKFAQAAGCSMISASANVAAFPDIFKTLEKLADQYDINIGIHNHGGYDWLGSLTMLGNIFKHTGPRIGLCLDSAWCLQSGEDPLKAAEQFNDRLFGTHIKDFTFSPDGKGHDVVVGTGNLKLKEYMALVMKAPRCRAVTLEYEGDEHNPGPKLSECVKMVAGAV
jgi:inosose dehydratase